MKRVAPFFVYLIWRSRDGGLGDPRSYIEPLCWSLSSSVFFCAVEEPLESDGFVPGSMMILDVADLGEELPPSIIGESG